MKTVVGSEYTLTYLERIFINNTFRFEGRNSYDVGKSSEFLIIDEKETYLWSGQIEASGATYKRID